MTHIQLDDAFFDHPKVLSVGKDAKILAVAAICYAGNRLTDGFIPFGAIAVLAAKTGVSKPKPAVDELIASRLWEHTEGGYVCHDYLDYNATAAKVREKQQAAKDRMQRLRSQDVRANNERTNGEQTAKFARSSRNVRDTTTTTDGSYEPNGSTEPELAPPVEKSRRKIRLPEGWEPTDRQREALAAEGYSADEISAELVKFRNHHGHKGDTGLNWALSFSNWMAKSREFARPRALTPNGMPPEIARLPWNNATRMKWEQEHRSA